MTQDTSSRDADGILSAILTGQDARRAQGFMLILPQGFRMEALIERKLAAIYGSLAHPDLRFLTPEGAGNIIKVETIRDTLPFLAATPASEPMKTLVIARAHRMNESAANALLKSLEEPTASTRIIIMTDRPDELPVTIRSRCAVHNLKASQAHALEELRADLGDDVPKSASALEDALLLADGDPSLAAQMIRFKLVAWSKKVSEWMRGADPTPPMPTLNGKSGAPLYAVALCLQSLLIRRCRDDLAADLSGKAALEAAWKIVEGVSDIDRTGIDAKTRLHSLLLGARRALQ